MAHKSKHRPNHLKRKDASFLARYGMTRQQWTQHKRALHKSGEAFKIDILMRAAIR